MSLRFPEYLSTQGAPSKDCRVVFALIAVSIEAVGCQKARSGSSPVATLVWMFCSYGSGIATIFTSAPVNFSKPLTTPFIVVLAPLDPQMVRLTPLRLVFSAGHVVGPAVPPPESGLLHPARTRVAAAANTAALFQEFFIELLLRGGLQLTMSERYDEVLLA